MGWKRWEKKDRQKFGHYLPRPSHSGNDWLWWRWWIQAWVKIGDITLTNDHRDDLLGGKWLNDYHIHATDKTWSCTAAHQYLGRHYIVPGEMVQILHSRGNHRLTVNIIGVSTTQWWGSMTASMLFTNMHHKSQLKFPPLRHFTVDIYHYFDTSRCKSPPLWHFMVDI